MNPLEAYESLLRLMCEDAVKVDFLKHGWLTEVRVTASATDMRRLIGESARTFRALSGVLRGLSKGMRSELVLLPIVMEKGTVARNFRPFAQRADWPRDRVETLVHEVACAAFPGVPLTTDTVDSEGSVTNVLLRVNLPKKMYRPAAIFAEALNRVVNVVGIQIGRMLNARLEAI